MIAVHTKFYFLIELPLQHILGQIFQFDIEEVIALLDAESIDL